MSGTYAPPRYGKAPAVSPFANLTANARFVSGGVARGPLAPPTNWGAIGAHFAVVGGLVWLVSKKPVLAAVVGAGVAWALQTDAAKAAFQH